MEARRAGCEPHCDLREATSPLGAPAVPSGKRGPGGTTLSGSPLSQQGHTHLEDDIPVAFSCLCPTGRMGPHSVDQAAPGVTGLEPRLPRGSQTQPNRTCGPSSTPKREAPGRHRMAIKMRKPRHRETTQEDVWRDSDWATGSRVLTLNHCALLPLPVAARVPHPGKARRALVPENVLFPMERR